MSRQLRLDLLHRRAVSARKIRAAVFAAAAVAFLAVLPDCLLPVAHLAPPSASASSSGSAAATAAQRKTLAVAAEAKTNLQQQPTEPALAALERSWEKNAAVTDLSQIQGTWDMQLSKGGDARGWASGGWWGSLLRLYTGGLGKLLNMKVRDAPVLEINTDGGAASETTLQWGLSSDKVIMQSKLVVIAPNKLREIPSKVHSTALRLTGPALRPVRELRVTYFDGELLVLRDQRGIADVLWRRGGAPAAAVVEREGTEEDNEDIADVAQVQAGANDGKAWGSRVLAEVEALDGAFARTSARAEAERAEQALVAGELKRLERALDEAVKATAAAEAGSKVVAALREKNRGSATSQVTLVEEAQQRAAEAVAELNERKADLFELDKRIHHAKVHEGSLHQQVELIRLELKRTSKGDRAALPSYRAALAEVRKDINACKKEQRDLKSDKSRGGQHLEAASKALDKAKRELAKVEQPSVDFQVLLEAQLGEHVEYGRRIEAAREREASWATALENARARVVELDRRQAEDRSQVAAAEEAARQLLQHARGINSRLGDKRRGWLWR